VQDYWEVGGGASRESIMIKIMIKTKSFCDGHDCPSCIRSFRHRTQNLTHLQHVLKGKRSYRGMAGSLAGFIRSETSD